MEYWISTRKSKRRAFENSTIHSALLSTSNLGKNKQDFSVFYSLFLVIFAGSLSYSWPLHFKFLKHLSKPFSLLIQNPLLELFILCSNPHHCLQVQYVCKCFFCQIYIFLRSLHIFSNYSFPNMFGWGTSKATQLSVLKLNLLSCPQISFLSRTTYHNEWSHNVYNCASQKLNIWSWSVLVSHHHRQYFFIYYWYYLLSISQNCLLILTPSSVSSAFVSWTTLIVS